MAEAANTSSAVSGWDFEDHVRGTLYGHACGDAIGLLTEFMTKKEVKEEYSKLKQLEYADKIKDFHRVRWKDGDWTDDTDQMILIMDMLLDKDAVVDVPDFGRRMRDWANFGFKELGDFVGMGIGDTTNKVLKHKQHKTDPHAAAADIWEQGGRQVASNGAVMRTSILGIHRYDCMDTVIRNTEAICKVTHADPRCVASCVAVVSAIAFMFQRQPQHLTKSGDYNVNALIKDAYKLAKPYLQGDNYKKHKKALKHHMFATKLSALSLDESSRIGYTYKAMGSGFWALRQPVFRTAMEQLVLEGGDADTNGAVAGALLGCKLGASRLPPTWRDNLLHKQWLDQKIDRFLALQASMSEPKSDSLSEKTS